jgi:hypothetical protein
MHAFWFRGKVGVDCVLDGVKQRLERRVAVELFLGAGQFDVSRVAGVHCRWLTAGGGHPKDNSCTLFGSDGWMLYTQ